MINLKRAFKRSDLCNITRLSGLKCAKGISKTYQMQITSFKNVEFISFFTLKPGNGSFYPSRVFSIAPVPYSKQSGAFLCMMPTSVRVTVTISDKQSAHLGRSYPCPGWVDRHDCLLPCFSVLCELCMELELSQIAPHSVHPPQSGPSSRSLPSHLHRCYFL